MILIVYSTEDLAGINIFQRLMETVDWELQDDLKFDGNEVYTYKKNAVLVNINEYHLYFDHVDSSAQGALGDQGFEFNPETVIFLSKHRSASGMKTLTVHPIGNYRSKAEYGGSPEKLVPASPHLMTEALRKLYDNAKKADDPLLEYEVTFEVTHHGPYLETPTFFIEIGSDEITWCDAKAGQVIAKTIMGVIDLAVEDPCKSYPVALGMGGGHYAPRHSEVARNKLIAFGHMIPSYALDAGLPEYMLEHALESTPGVELIYFQRKAFKKQRYRELQAWFEERGYKPIRANDLGER